MFGPVSMSHANWISWIEIFDTKFCIQLWWKFSRTHHFYLLWWSLNVYFLTSFHTSRCWVWGASGLLTKRYFELNFISYSNKQWFTSITKMTAGGRRRWKPNFSYIKQKFNSTQATKVEYQIITPYQIHNQFCKRPINLHYKKIHSY